MWRTGGAGAFRRCDAETDHAVPGEDRCHIMRTEIIYCKKAIQEDGLCLAEAAETMIHRLAVC